MFICAAGDIHGAIDRFYDDVLAFEAALGVRFQWVLHVGAFGIWPDSDRIDKAHHMSALATPGYNSTTLICRRRANLQRGVGGGTQH